MLKNLIKYLVELNTNTVKISSQPISKLNIYFATVQYNHPDGNGSILVNINVNEDNPRDFSLVKNADGVIDIVINFNAAVLNYAYNDPLILAGISKALGHLLAGHTEDKLTISNLKIERLLSNAETNVRKLSRATMCELLRGGVSQIELEADVIAASFVGVRDLVLLHTLTLPTYNNVLKLECINRITKLLTLDATDRLKQENCSLQIKFNPMLS